MRQCFIVEGLEREMAKRESSVEDLGRRDIVGVTL